MPTTRNSSSSQDNSQGTSSFAVDSQDDTVIHCPFRDLDSCNNGVRGRGLAKVSFGRHLHVQHCSSEEKKGLSRERISSNAGIYANWETVLTQLQKWLCTKCMILHAWSKPCRMHEGDITAGPYDDGDVKFLIHGIDKPLPYTPATHAVLDEDAQVGLTLDLLNRVFQKQIPTVSSIRPPCRLHFSRTLKAALDKVLLKPLDSSSWIQLLLLPVCTLKLFIPISNLEARSGTRKRLQIAAINQALLQWREPSDCLILTRKLLEFSRLTLKKTQHSDKETCNLNLRACQKKLSYGHYTAAIRVLSSNGIAPFTEDTLRELRQKHPHAPAPSIPPERITVASITTST